MENNEYELYRTVSIREKEELQRRLVKARCSYLEKWKKLSIFRRRDFGGAKEVCVIYVNANQREQADAVLEEFLNMRQTRRSRRRGSSRRPAEERRARQPRMEARPEPPKTQTIAIEKVSPASYDPYSAGGEVPEDSESRYSDVRPSYITGGAREEAEYMEESDNGQEGYVLGDEYAELEYADEPEEAYGEGRAYSDPEFEDDYNDDEESFSEDDEYFDDDFDDNDIYEDEPQRGERRVMLINEADGDDGYFLDDGPRLRGSTRVRGGEGSNPNDEFIDDFNFD
ncbi:MAG: hypothetical protein J6O71_03365 [Lachnospiraceae bacterium]|nr:hypothetical protein [Lachnospiraceae bacterium]